jgi:gliding motility-associated-like protein
MISLKKILFSALLCCFTSIVLAQNISVDDTKNATDLVNILTNSSTCLTLAGQTASPLPITIKSYGSFDYTGTNFPFANGIVLSTWSAKKSEGPYSEVNSSGGLSTWAGDAELDFALGITIASEKTVNATVLEFDFTPQTNFISFRYLFASNEYQKDYPCNYSDGFAFLIKDVSPSILPSTYTNLAVIPGTTTPVSSLNIHPDINYTDIRGYITKCNAQNATYFNRFNTVSSPINYAGQTIPMTAEATVIPGNKYHIKLVVADSRNKYYNSAVFIEAGSFSSKIDLKASKTNPVCFGESVTLDAGSTSGTYKWFKNSSPTAIPSAITSTYTVTDPGTYTVEATILGCPAATGQITIDYAPKINLNNTPLQLCNTGTSTFDLTKANADLISTNNTDITTIEYFENYTLSTGVSTPIATPTAYPGNANNLVYAKLTNKYGCSAEGAEITLNIVSSSPAISSLPLPIISDFSGNGNSVELVPPSTRGPFEYSLALVGTNYQSSPLFTNLVAGIYTAYIRDTTTCDYWTDFVPLLDYPRYFTPNGDGYHDTWGITNLNVTYHLATITIFDRYGKLLKQFGATDSWDGKYIGNDLPSDDYWFHVNLADGRIIKGHFSLKR